MKRFLFISCVIVIIPLSWVYAGSDSLRIQLNKAIENSAGYDSAKIKIIDSLRMVLKKSGDASLKIQYDIQQRLYEEYRIFKYDSAFRYARNLQELAYRINDSGLIAGAKLKLCFILLSAGLYKEAFDSLSSVIVKDKPAAFKAEYYTLMGRYYYDLAGYDDDHYHSVDYDIIGSRFLDSALLYYPEGSFEKTYYTGLKNLKQYKTGEALPFFEKLIADPNLTDHQLALTASTMSGIYLANNQPGKTIDLLTRAAESDIKSSTKETFAIFNLAALLYKNGDVKQASVYIETAIADAAFYGARQRKVQMSSLLPLIEGQRINSVEAQKNILIKYALVVTGLVLLLVGLSVIILKQNKRIKASKEQISLAHIRQQEINQKLEEINWRLEEVNEKLEESNKIKEEYIGYFFNMDSEFFTKLEKLKRNLEQKVADRKLDDIKFIVNNIDPRREKEALLTNFDKVFLKLFPNFPEVFNSLFHPDDQILIKDNILTNDHRIYALIRMGITDSEKIAQILDYSVKTIYAYKTRIKNKSISPKTFEERIMEIKTV
jgi:Domain of unknown function (DUF6377)